MNGNSASRKVLLACSLALPAGPALTQDFGRFEGTVQTEWLDPEGDHRRMRLLSDFSYVDPNGQLWLAPSGWIIDGASIPQLFWNIIGSPFDGAYRRASVIHDVACDQKERPWKEVHRAFYYAMRAEGLGALKAKLMYGAVFAGGPRWEAQMFSYVEAAHAPEAALAMMRDVPAGYRTASIQISTGEFAEEETTMPFPGPVPAPSPGAEGDPDTYVGTEVALVLEEVAPRRSLQAEDLEMLSARIEENVDISLDEIEVLVSALNR